MPTGNRDTYVRSNSLKKRMLDWKIKHYVRNTYGLYGEAVSAAKLHNRIFRPKAKKAKT